MISYRWIVGGFLFLTVSCQRTNVPVTALPAGMVILEDSLFWTVSSEWAWKKESLPERRMREMGLVDIREWDPSIQVVLKYATEANFTGKKLYTDLNKAFMLPETARRLVRAQVLLKRMRPGLSLVVYDAARPLSVQREMWEQVKGTPQHIFVSNPERGGGLHNYGAAVDVSLVDTIGRPLNMGSDFDYFGEEARVDRESELLKNGRITPRELENRLLLRKVMVSAGFIPLQSEWWHFNLMSSRKAKQTLALIP